MTVYPLTFSLLGFQVTGFGILMMLAFLVAGWVMQLELQRRRLNPEFSADIVVAGVVGGILGARVWYVALHGGPLFSRAGLVWYGGFLAAARAEDYRVPRYLQQFPRYARQRGGQVCRHLG